MSVDGRLKELHDRIDVEFDVRLAQLEEERQERHEALDKLWPIISSVAAFPSPESFTKSIEAGNGSHREGRRAFPMRRAVSEIIERLEEGAEISQPQIYEELMRGYPELRGEPPLNMRAQIASVLNWITKNGRLIVAKEGRGSYPNVYRKPNPLDGAFPETKQGLLGENS